MSKNNLSKQNLSKQNFRQPVLEALNSIAVVVTLASYFPPLGIVAGILIIWCVWNTSDRKRED